MPWLIFIFTDSKRRELNYYRFQTVGSDLAEAAINRARKKYPDDPNVNFIVDDILNTRFKDDEFDYILDRGCFHVLSPSDRNKYINKIHQIL
ncbi:MAG TPA: class I SAM-dependent methyltransferase, partial [Nitrososphaeraceae archaeon]|nr:class I SAM-dependent methyltransferase [Nitrososphaeraceae archaeon]